MSRRLVLDSFALLVHYWDEPGASSVGRLLGDPANECWMTVVNVGEVYYQAARRVRDDATDPHPDALLEDMLRLPVRFVSADLPLALDAARLKAIYALSYADCFAAALAQQLDARVLTGDPEFERLERDAVIGIEWLPPKRKHR